MEELKTITREELKEKMDKDDDFVLLEVVGESFYQRPHLRLTCQVRSGSRTWISPLRSCPTGARRSSLIARTSIDTPRRGSSVS